VSNETARKSRAVWFAVALGALVVLAAVAAQGARDSDPSTSVAVPPPAAATTPPPAPTTEEAPPSSLADLVRRDPADPAALGAVDAPVVLIEYADFRCKYCALFAEETLPALVEQYVDDGTLRIEWRDAPVLGETSLDAAVAGRAAGRQGLFWELYDELYAVTIDGKPDWTREALLRAARKVPGLDEAAFTTALDDPALQAAVEAEAAESQRLGVTGTPTFVLGENVLQGAQPLAVFQQAIEAEAAASR
jgi:protein-disulfide isomerase